MLIAKDRQDKTLMTPTKQKATCLQHVSVHGARQFESSIDELIFADCEIVLNDDLIYKTRVKQYSSMPFFEAGTEVFVHDYTEAVARVIIRGKSPPFLLPLSIAG